MNGSDWLWAAFSIQAFSLLAAFVAFVAVCIIHIFDCILTDENESRTETAGHSPIPQHRTGRNGYIERRLLFDGV